MDPAANFKLVIIQTELERFKFLVRSFLRARMAKVGVSELLPCMFFLAHYSYRSTNIPTTSTNSTPPKTI